MTNEITLGVFPLASGRVDPDTHAVFVVFVAQRPSGPAEQLELLVDEERHGTSSSYSSCVRSPFSPPPDCI